jgi:hypothetical protein
MPLSNEAEVRTCERTKRAVDDVEWRRKMVRENDEVRSKRGGFRFSI